MRGLFVKHKINFVLAHPNVKIEPSLAEVLNGAKMLPSTMLTRAQTASAPIGGSKRFCPENGISMKGAGRGNLGLPDVPAHSPRAPAQVPTQAVGRKGEGIAVRGERCGKALERLLRSHLGVVHHGFRISNGAGARVIGRQVWASCVPA